MIVTKDTTIEEYKAWLASNPSLSEFSKAVRSTFKALYRTLGQIGKLVKRISKPRACTSAKLVARPVYPSGYEPNRPFRHMEFNRWLREIRFELKMTSAYLEGLELADCLDDEIAMEVLKIQALEILHNNTR